MHITVPCADPDRWTRGPGPIENHKYSCGHNPYLNLDESMIQVNHIGNLGKIR